MNTNIIPRELIDAINRRVPNFGTNLSFDASRNMVVNSGWTSGLGHYYYQGVRANDRLTAVFSLGRASWGTLYLNQVDVYCNDGRSTRIIGTRSHFCTSFSNMVVASDCAEILKGYIGSQMKLIGACCSDQKMMADARALAATLCEANTRMLMA